MGYKLYETKRKEEFDSVCQKYPSAPRTFLLKADLIRRGISPTKAAMEKLQEPYYEHCPEVLFQWHHADRTTAYKVPGPFCLNDGTCVWFILSPPPYDPYTLDLIDDQFWILSDGEPLEEAHFFKKPGYYDKLTSSGVPMQKVANLGGPDLFYYCQSRHCNSWNNGLQCKFCDMDYNAKHQMKMGRGFKIQITPEEIYETTCEALQEKGRWRFMFLTGGADPRDGFDRELEININLIKAITKAGKDVLGVDRLPLNIIMAPLEDDQYRRLYDAGISGFGSYLEVWDKEKWKLTCPGKEANIGYDKWIEKTIRAVDIFGEGNVVCGFVAGIEMAPPPYGFEDVDEAVSSSLGGFDFLIKNGVIPVGTQWSVMPGTDFFKMGATPPPLEFYAKLDMGRFELMKKYGRKVLAHQWYYKHQPLATHVDWLRLL